MSLTKDQAAPRELRNFFLDRLMPLADKRRGEGKVFFELKPDPRRETYYVARPKTTMEPNDFEISGLSSFEDFEAALRRLWTEQGCPELAELAPAVANLARMLYSREEPSEEVSPFIYVMF